MGDDVELKRQWSTDRTWYKLADPRALSVKRATGGSRTVQDRWFYGPDERLSIRFETDPDRGFGVWLDEHRIGFSPEMAPEPQLGDTIRAAKRLAVELLGRHGPK